MKRLLHVIADYEPMSQEFGEILQRIWSQNWDIDLAILPTSVPSMDTIGTGFLTCQLALGPNPPGTVFYVNTAPRKERRGAMTNNAGEKLVWARVAVPSSADDAPREVELVAVNSGYSLSLLRDHIVELRRLEVPHDGSQFRSRDFFPAVVADILHGRHAERLLEPHPVDELPAFPESAVMWTDGFGNIKTSIRRSAVRDRWEEGRKIHIRIGGRRATALVTGGVFSVDEGELAWSVGSSGHADPFMEILLRGGSAADLFDNPRAGAQVELTE
jgi:hypothetical protein